jgi:hypothetical protein
MWCRWPPLPRGEIHTSGVGVRDCLHRERNAGPALDHQPGDPAGALFVESVNLRV